MYTNVPKEILLNSLRLVNSRNLLVKSVIYGFIPLQDPLPPHADAPTLMEMTSEDLSSYFGKFLRKFKLLQTTIIFTLSTLDILESEFKLDVFLHPLSPAWW